METPPVIPRQRLWHWKPAALLLAGVLGLVYLWRFEPVSSGVYPQCVVHRLTGLLCPGCGVLRSAHAALHGRWLDSLRDNPLLWAGMVVLPLWLAREWRLGRSPLHARITPLGFRVVILVVLGFTIARNLPFVPFAFLSPAR